MIQTFRITSLIQQKKKLRKNNQKVMFIVVYNLDVNGAPSALEMYLIAPAPERTLFLRSI